jgi:hypothetical protein
MQKPKRRTPVRNMDLLTTLAVVGVLLQAIQTAVTLLR